MTDDDRSPPGLAPGVAERVAHLEGVTLEMVLAGAVEHPTRVIAPIPGVEVEDIGAEDGPGVPVRCYRPETADGAGVLWVHGGAWIGGDLDMPEAHAVAQRLAAWLHAVVVSVDYRLAPTHPFPAAHDDVVAAFGWMQRLEGVDPARLVLGGASAGGNLAAGAAQTIRDGSGLQPRACVLAYPATDPYGGPYPDERPVVCPPLLWFDRTLTGLAFDAYLAGAAPVAPAVPAAGRLDDLPPTLVTTSSLDALAPQATRYAELLSASGVEVEHHRVEGVLHGYLDLCGDVGAADVALRRHCDWLAARLS